MYCDLWIQYIKMQKLFKGGNYSRAETIRGNTVSTFKLAIKMKQQNKDDILDESLAKRIYIRHNLTFKVNHFI